MKRWLQWKISFAAKGTEWADLIEGKTLKCYALWFSLLHSDISCCGLLLFSKYVWVQVLLEMIEAQYAFEAEAIICYVFVQLLTLWIAVPPDC